MREGALLYFDHQLTRPPKEGVVEKMAPFFHINWLSPVAPYSEMEKPLEEAKAHIMALLGRKGHLVFTSSGAEAVNHVVLGSYIDVTRKTGKNHFLATNFSEAPSILSMTRLQEMGCLFDMVEVNESGQLTKEALIESLTPRTALLSLSLGCGITGVFQKLEGVADLCQERGILLHIDVTHVLDKVPIAIDADFITFNGEQIGGPKGTGGLLIKEGVELSPLILGGNEQEGMRGGSFNVPAFVGLGEAARQALESRDHEAMETAVLRAKFEERVLSLLPDTKIVLKDQVRLPHVTTMLFPGVKTDALAYSLAQENLFASVGGGNFQQLHYLLKALKLDDSHCGLSFSFSSKMGQEELLKAAKLIFENVAKLKRYSEAI
ncbi:MAG: Cysteine desulfurase IscS [Chlamydiales bacterium]|nr:Cysteine desulfurase IscS [Chlamydiales bacterium]MCH9635700.1 Cysteine desulfurase IscS [Chlamydiales bacterium]MCH9704491.1 aminotransferase class V-fold PLP-dependent enzyme [Chlamydiota bacterium]